MNRFSLALVGLMLFLIGAFGQVTDVHAQTVNTGGSNLRHLPHENKVFFDRGRSGEFGRNNTMVLGSEYAPGARRGHYYAPARAIPNYHANGPRRGYRQGVVVGNGYRGQMGQYRQSGHSEFNHVTRRSSRVTTVTVRRYDSGRVQTFAGQPPAHGHVADLPRNVPLIDPDSVTKRF